MSKVTKIYFTKKGKTPEQIEEHREKVKTAHSVMMKALYKRKKITKNNKVKKEFNKIYEALKSIDGNVNISEIESNTEIMTLGKYTTMCFNKLYESALQVEKKTQEEESQG